jgi:hypothetical protein
VSVRFRLLLTAIVATLLVYFADCSCKSQK